MSEINIKAWSAAFVRGELDPIETEALKSMINSAEWQDLKRRRYLVSKQPLIKEIIEIPENSLKHVCLLLAMLMEKP